MTDPRYDSLAGDVDALKRDVQPLLDGKWVAKDDVPALLKTITHVSSILKNVALIGAAAWAAFSGIL